MATTFRTLRGSHDFLIKKIASLKKVQNRGLALFLTENVSTSYQRGYCNAEEAQYLLVFCKPLGLTRCYF